MKLRRKPESASLGSKQISIKMKLGSFINVFIAMLARWLFHLKLSRALVGQRLETCCESTNKRKVVTQHALKSIADVARGNQINLYCEYMRSRCTQTTASLQVLPLFSPLQHAIHHTTCRHHLGGLCLCVDGMGKSSDRQKGKCYVYNFFSSVQAVATFGSH